MIAEESIYGLTRSGLLKSLNSMPLLDFELIEFLDQIQDYISPTVEIENRFKADPKFEVMGAGVFSTVIKDPENKDLVKKIGVIEDNYLYLWYLTQCQKDPENPWFPKIQEIHHYKDFVIITIEKLQSTLNTVMRESLDPKSLSSKYKKVFTKQIKISNHTDLLKNWTQFMQSEFVDDKNLINALRSINQIRNLPTGDLNSHFDIWENNVMVRKNGELVIIDPFVG